MHPGTYAAVAAMTLVPAALLLGGRHAPARLASMRRLLLSLRRRLVASEQRRRYLEALNEGFVTELGRVNAEVDRLRADLREADSVATAERNAKAHWRRQCQDAHREERESLAVVHLN